MLKRLFFTLALSLGYATTLLAQGVFGANLVEKSHYKYKSYVLSLGPVISGNYSIPYNGYDISGGLGFNAGAAINLRFGRPKLHPVGTERFGVQIEFLYSTYNLNDDKNDYTLKCFDIPILFQWYVLPMWAIDAGITIMNANKISCENYRYGNIQDYDNGKSVFCVSFGYSFRFRNGFTANIRYNMGLSSMAENITANHSALSLGIGWMFNVIKK